MAMESVVVENRIKGGKLESLGLDEAAGYTVQSGANVMLELSLGDVVGHKIGATTDTMREIYAAVKRANEAAHAIAKPGVTCHEIDQAARQVIDAAGYGDYFTHRLGHGLGLSGHELPNVAPNDPTPLEVGMVFTIEPGIYHPEIGGVRIEDDVVVTEDGIESLSTFPKDL